jgi:hypothetical protein
MSVSGTFHGSAGSVKCNGVAGNTFHRGGYGSGAASSKLTVPVYVRGAAHTALSTKSQTSKK